MTTMPSVARVKKVTGPYVPPFQNGDVMLRIEPFRQAMKWRDFEYERPGEEG